MFSNVVGLVAGGASGLGRATTEHLVKLGARVVLCDLRTSQGQAVADELGDNVVFVPTDVTVEDDVSNALEVTKSKFGRLNLTVNCAGIGLAYKCFNFNTKVPHSQEDFMKLLKVNAGGTFNVARLCVALMAENNPDENDQKGLIVNTSSISAYEGQIGQVAYAAANGAINSMTLPFAREFSEQGIRTVTIAVGLFDTPLVNTVPVKVRAFLERITPFPKRLGKPTEYAHLVQTIYENPMLNGEVIRIDGAIRMMP